MTVLYKYLRKEHADLLIRRGRLRIGTLYEYRNTEKYVTLIGDGDEGKKSRYMNVGSEKWTSDNQPEFAKGVIEIASGVSATFQDCTIEKSEISPDYYVYCTAEEFDKNALQDFGYNSCVVIENPNQFFAAVTRTLRHKGTFKGVFSCQYIPRRVAHDQGSRYSSSNHQRSEL